MKQQQQAGSPVFEEFVYEVPKGAALVVKCDQAFTVYQDVGELGGLRRRLPLGPESTTARAFRAQLEMDATIVILAPEGAALWVEVIPRRGEFDPVDPVPVQWPAGLKAPPSLEDRIRRLVRNELSRQAQEAGAGTFEEEDDFEDTDPELLPESPYEVVDMVPEYPVSRREGATPPPSPTGGSPAGSPGEPKGGAAAPIVPDGKPKAEPAPPSA